MKSRFQIFGHPIHAMLVAYPIALYLIALVCDLIYLWRGDPFWYRMAFWSILFGLIGNLAAGASGILDLVALRKEVPAATRPAMIHLFVGSLLVVIYLSSLALRDWGVVHDGAPVVFLPIILNFIGSGFVGLQGWYGGELVYRYGIGIDQEER
ncbi:MAG: DUF2231 domain-containing protein [Nitrospiria bacterium]